MINVFKKWVWNGTTGITGRADFWKDYNIFDEKGKVITITASNFNDLKSIQSRRYLSVLNSMEEVRDGLTQLKKGLP